MDPKRRVVILVDMDCFYCQVEENSDPKLTGKPIAVVQYNQWRGGGIIAVNYPARDRGVTRHMRGKEAKEKCPEINLVTVPSLRGKADLTKYREAGKRVAEVLQTFTTLLERASVDEAYLDITEAVEARLAKGRVMSEQLRNTHVVGFETVEDYLEAVYGSREFGDEGNLRLAVGGAIAEEIRAAVLDKTGYKCSAGVAHNKILAKLVCGLHKPNQQTVLPHESVPALYSDLPVRKIKSLGGKFGNVVAEKLNISYVGELLRFSERELVERFDDKTGLWLYNIARGVDNEPVTVRLVSKSIACCKKFPGRTALVTPTDVRRWLGELALEIAERLERDVEENNRRAKQLVVSFTQEVDRRDVASSRTQTLHSYDPEKIADMAFEVVKKNCGNVFRVKFLGLNASKFEEVRSGGGIMEFFRNCTTKRCDDTLDCAEERDTTVGRCEDTIDAGEAEGEECNSDDSITGELAEEPKESFFSRYMTSCRSPTERNFDTSVVLEEEEVAPSVPEGQCPECKKSIPIAEMQSHTDYHFAAKLVEEQRRPQKTVKVEAKPVKKGVKRKVPCAKLTSFFVAAPPKDVATELCTECSRHIPVDQLSDHADYHYAKRLHRELNAPQQGTDKNTGLAAYFKPA